MPRKPGHPLISALAATAFALLSASAQAAPIFWTDWIGTNPVTTGFEATGTITTGTANFGVTYPNDIGLYQPSGVPEPGSLALLAAGLLGFAAPRRRRAH